MRIAVDLDDTLVNFAEQLVKFHNSEFNTGYSVGDFHTYVFWEVWGGDREKNKEEVYRYYESEYFNDIAPLPGAFEAISRLSMDNELFIITARHQDISELTKRQVHSIFPDMFSEVYFANNHLLKSEANSGAKSKAVICDELGIDVLIEDSPENANESVSDSRRVFLFNRPWNVNRKTDERVIRVDSWKEVIDKI